MSQTIIDEKIAKVIFTKEQIAQAKETDGTLSDQYVLNKQTNPVISRSGLGNRKAKL